MDKMIIFVMRKPKIHVFRISHKAKLNIVCYTTCNQSLTQISKPGYNCFPQGHPKQGVPASATTVSECKIAKSQEQKTSIMPFD